MSLRGMRQILSVLLAAAMTAIVLPADDKKKILTKSAIEKSTAG